MDDHNKQEKQLTDDDGNIFPAGVQQDNPSTAKIELRL